MSARTYVLHALHAMHACLGAHRPAPAAVGCPSWLGWPFLLFMRAAWQSAGGRAATRGAAIPADVGHAPPPNIQATASYLVFIDTAHDAQPRTAHHDASCMRPACTHVRYDADDATADGFRFVTSRIRQV